jgi:hypothetical protein
MSFTFLHMVTVRVSRVLRTLYVCGRRAAAAAATALQRTWTSPPLN